MKTRRFALQLSLSLILILAVLLSGCGPTAAPEEPAATEAPAPTEAPAATEAAEPAAPAAGSSISENVATQAVAVSMPAIDPDLMLTFDHTLGFQMYDTLTIWDPDEGVLPSLATSWESNEDGTEWTFQLREGVTFHDGTHFTAEAVKFSYDRTIETGLMGYYFAGLEEIEIVDDYTVKLKYSVPRPAPTMLAAGYGMFIVNPNIADKPEGWLSEGNDAGTGPYMLESTDSTTRWVLTQYEDYWGGWEEGQFTKIVYVLVEDPTVRQQMISSGEADITTNIPFDSHAALEATGEVTVNPAAQFWNIFIQFHLDKEPMDNLQLRQALVHAFPYEIVEQALYGGKGTQAQGIVPKGLWEPPVDMERPSYDLEMAEQLLAEAGYADGVEIKYAMAAGDVEEQQMALLWQAELAKIGVDLKPEEVTNAAWWDGAYNPDNEFDMMNNTWAPGWPSPSEFTILYDSVNTFTPYVAYANPEFDNLVTQGLEAESTDMEEANRLYAQAQQLLYDDAVGVFVLDIPLDFSYRNDIKGFEPNPNYFDVVFWYNMRRE